MNPTKPHKAFTEPRFAIPPRSPSSSLSARPNTTTNTLSSSAATPFSTSRNRSTSSNNNNNNNNNNKSTFVNSVNAQPPPWTAKRVRPIEHHASAFRKTALEGIQEEEEEDAVTLKNNLEKKRRSQKQEEERKKEYERQKRSRLRRKYAQNHQEGGNVNDSSSHYYDDEDFDYVEEEEFDDYYEGEEDHHHHHNTRGDGLSLRDRDSWKTLSTMTHHSEEAALAAIRRIFATANLRRKKHLEKVSRRDTKATKREDAGKQMLISLGIDPSESASAKNKNRVPVIDPLIRCMSGTTFLGDLIALSGKSAQEVQMESVGAGAGNGDGSGEIFRTVVPEEFWVFEDTPLISSIGLDEDIKASQERMNPNVPESQRKPSSSVTHHAASLSARVFPSRGAKCADSRVEVYYLANALDTMIQRYLNKEDDQHHLFPRYPTSAQLQEREEILFDIVHCGMREIVRHSAARTVERGKVLERLRLALEQLWESRKTTLDRAQAEIQDLQQVNDPHRFIDLERLVEQQALRIEQLELSVQEYKEQNEILKGMDQVLKLAHDKERVASEFLTRQAARNVTLSRLQQQISLDMSSFEHGYQEGEEGIGSQGTTTPQTPGLHPRSPGNRSPQTLNLEQHGGRKTFAPILEMTAADAKMTRNKSNRSLGRRIGSAKQQRSSSSNNNNNNNNNSNRDGDGNTSSNNNNNKGDDDNNTKASSSDFISNLAQSMATLGHHSILSGGGKNSPSDHDNNSSNNHNNAPPVETRDFCLQVNMERAADRGIMETTRSLLETTGTMLHVADRLTTTFYGNDISSQQDLIGHNTLETLKQLTRKTLFMEAQLREDATAPLVDTFGSSSASAAAAASASSNNNNLLNNNNDESSGSGAFSFLNNNSSSASSPLPLFQQQQQNLNQQSALSSNLARFFPSDNVNKVIFDKNTLNDVLSTVSDASREVHVRMMALSKHPGVVNAVDPLVPPASPDQPCTLCGRTVLRRAEEGEDELQHAIDQIQQLSAALDRSNQEKEMFKEDILRLESKLRRKGLALACDVGTDADPDLLPFKQPTPEESRQQAEFSAGAVLKAVKAFRSLIFIDGDFVQQKRARRTRRRTLQIGGSSAIKLHSAVSMFKAASNLKKSSMRRSPSNHHHHHQNSSSGRQQHHHHSQDNNTKESFQLSNALNFTSAGSFNNSAFGSFKKETSAGLSKSPSPVFIETGAFGENHNNNNNVSGGNSPTIPPISVSGPSPGRGGRTGGRGGFQKHTTSKSPSPLQVSSGHAANILLSVGKNNNSKSKSPSPPGGKHHKKPHHHQHGAKAKHELEKQLQDGDQQKVSIRSPSMSGGPGGGTPAKPLAWILKHFFGALKSYGKSSESNLRKSVSSSLNPNSSSSLEDERKASFSSSSPPSPTSASASSSRLGSRVGSFLLSRDISGLSTMTTTLEDALADHFRTILGTKALVEENLAAFHASWPAYVRQDPRITLIEKLLDTKSTKLKSTRSLMLYITSQVNKALDENAEHFVGERSNGSEDDDPRQPNSVSLHLALQAFHSVCQHSSFFKSGAENLVLYSSSSLSSSSSSSASAASGAGGGDLDSDGLPRFGFFSREDAKGFLPGDSSRRQIMRCRVLLLALILEKANGNNESTNPALTAGMSGIFTRHHQQREEGPSSSEENPNYGKKYSLHGGGDPYRDAVMEFADCCGTSEPSPDALVIPLEERGRNMSFSESFGSLMAGRERRLSPPRD